MSPFELKEISKPVVSESPDYKEIREQHESDELEGIQMLKLKRQILNKALPPCPEKDLVM